jgi:hypothetical protein
VSSVIEIPTIELLPGEVLALRTCRKDMTSHNRFLWPESGEVSAPDWSEEACCGFGLHGLLKGEGDGDLLNWKPDAKWLVVAVQESEVVDLGGDKVKFPRCRVVYTGDRFTATAIIAVHHPGSVIVGGTATAGDRGTATAGYGGTATAGDRGTATAGYGGTATAGDRGTATAGDRGTLQIRYYDFAAGRYRLTTGYTGENGIEPNKKYKLNEAGVLIPAE